MTTRKISQLPSVNLGGILHVNKVSGVYHDEYEVENLDFVVKLPDHIREGQSKARQQDYLLHIAAVQLAEKLLALDGVFTIDTRYIIETHETEVFHRMRVLVKKP